MKNAEKIAWRFILVVLAVFVLLNPQKLLAGGFTGACNITGGEQDDTGTVPHRGCSWGNGEPVENQTMILVSQAPNCSDIHAATCTMNVDFYDSVTGEFIENKNIEVPGQGGGGQPCELNPGDELCGHQGLENEIGEDCGDGSNGGGSGNSDESCGCNPAEGDEACCFTETGHSVDLRTGYYNHSDRDVVILGPGANIEFERYYNSNRGELEFRLDQDPDFYRWRQDYPNIMGYGWRHRYQERVRVLIPEFLDCYPSPGNCDWGKDSLFNKRTVVYYRSDGVGSRFEHPEGSTDPNEFEGRGTLDRMEREGDNLVVTKPSGERHVFELPSGYGDEQRPIDVPLRRIEAYKTPDGSNTGGMTFVYCGEDSSCNRTDCPESARVEYLCKIVLDEREGLSGLSFHYDEENRIERIMSEDDNICLAVYQYDQWSNLRGVAYNDNETDVCQEDSFLEYEYDVGFEGDLKPPEAFDCARLDSEDEECEWICGEDQDGNCLPLWRVCTPPKGGSCDPWCVLVGGECRLAEGMGICPPPDPQGQCEPGCDPVEQIEWAVCVPEEPGTECEPPSYGICEPGCVRDTSEARITLVCVPQSDPGTGECSGRGKSYSLEGYWGEDTLCAYSEKERVRQYNWLSSIRDEDGIELENVNVSNNPLQKDFGKVISVITPTEFQIYLHQEDEVRVEGYAFGHQVEFAYTVNYDSSGLQTIDGNCGCGPVQEIQWGEANGKSVVKWMKSGRKDGENSYTVYTYDNHGRTNWVIMGKSDNDPTDTTSDTRHPESVMVNYYYDTTERSTPTKIQVDAPPLVEVGCPGDARSEIEFDYHDPGGNLTDRVHRIIRRGCAVVIGEDGTRSGDDREEVTVISYDGRGRIKTIDGPRDDVVDIMTFTYHESGADKGYLKTVIYPNNLSMQYNDYNMFGLPEEVIDFNDQVWQMEYDGRGRLTSFQKPGGSTYGIEYLNGRIYRIQLPKGNIIEYPPREIALEVRGILQRTRKLPSPTSGPDEFSHQYEGFRGVLNKLVYGDSQNPSRYTYTSHLETEFGYLGYFHWIRNTSVQDSLAYRVFYHDDLGNLSMMWDELHPKNEQIPSLVFNQDALNRVSDVSAHVDWGSNDLAGRSYEYDRFGGLSRVWDFGRKTTRYVRDQFSRITMIDSPDSGETWLSYDSAGNMIRRQSPLGTSDYEYDSLNRLTSVVHSDGTTVQYFYDSQYGDYSCGSPPGNYSDYLKGRLATVVDTSGTSHFAYNQEGTLSKELRRQSVYGVDCLEHELAYEYDANGNLSSITYPSGQVLRYELPAGKDRPVGVSVEDASGEEHPLALGIEYFPFGSVRRYDLPNGVSTEIEKDSQYKTTYIRNDLRDQPWSLSLHGIVYDDVGNVESTMSAINVTSETLTRNYQGFSYDPQRQLISAWMSEIEDGQESWVENYYLDADGNREFMDTEDKSFTYIYEPDDCLVGEQQHLKTSNRIRCIIDPVFEEEAPECEDIDPHKNDKGKGHGKRKGRGHHTCAPDAPPGQSKKNDKDGDGVPDDLDLSGLDIDFAGMLSEIGDLLNSIPLGDLLGGDQEWKKGASRKYNSILGRLNAILNKYGLHQKVIRRVFLQDQNFHRMLAKFLDRRMINGPRWTEEDKILGVLLINAAKAVEVEAGVRGIAEYGLVVTAVEYDGAGNIIRKGDVCFDWSVDGRLMRIGLLPELPEGVNPLGDIAEEYCPQMLVAAEFEYDAWGRRTKKTVFGLETFFVYSGAGELLAEGVPGEWATEYFYLDGKPLAMSKGLSSAIGGFFGCASPGVPIALGALFFLMPLGLFFHLRRTRRKVGLVLLGGGSILCLLAVGTCLPGDGDGEPVPYSLGETGYFFYHNDQRGAPLYLTDENGQVSWLAKYRPYGEVELNEDPDDDKLSLTQNLRYPGQYDDRLDRLLPLGENFYYNMMRYYDPAMGRYLQPEWGFGFTTNTFPYALQNPFSWIDPLGQIVEWGNERTDWLKMIVHQARSEHWITDLVFRHFERSDVEHLRIVAREGKRGGFEEVACLKNGDCYKLYIDPKDTYNPCRAQVHHELISGWFSKLYETGEWDESELDWPGKRAHNYAEFLLGAMGYQVRYQHYNPYKPFATPQAHPYMGLGKSPTQVIYLMYIHALTGTR